MKNKIINLIVNLSNLRFTLKTTINTVFVIIGIISIAGTIYITKSISSIINVWLLDSDNLHEITEIDIVRFAYDPKLYRNALNQPRSLNGIKLKKNKALIFDRKFSPRSSALIKPHAIILNDPIFANDSSPRTADYAIIELVNSIRHAMNDKKITSLTVIDNPSSIPLPILEAIREFEKVKPTTLIPTNRTFGIYDMLSYASFREILFPMKPSVKGSIMLSLPIEQEYIQQLPGAIYAEPSAGAPISILENGYKVRSINEFNTKGNVIKIENLIFENALEKLEKWTQVKGDDFMESLSNLIIAKNKLNYNINNKTFDTYNKAIYEHLRVSGVADKVKYNINKYHNAISEKGISIEEYYIPTTSNFNKKHIAVINIGDNIPKTSSLYNVIDLLAFALIEPYGNLQSERRSLMNDAVYLNNIGRNIYPTILWNQYKSNFISHAALGTSNNRNQYHLGRLAVPETGGSIGDLIVTLAKMPNVHSILIRLSQPYDIIDPNKISEAISVIQKIYKKKVFVSLKYAGTSFISAFSNADSIFAEKDAIIGTGFYNRNLVALPPKDWQGIKTEYSPTSKDVVKGLYEYNQHRQKQLAEKNLQAKIKKPHDIQSILSRVLSAEELLGMGLVSKIASFGQVLNEIGIASKGRRMPMVQYSGGLNNVSLWARISLIRHVSDYFDDILSGNLLTESYYNVFNQREKALKIKIQELQSLYGIEKSGNKMQLIQEKLKKHSRTG